MKEEERAMEAAALRQLARLLQQSAAAGASDPFILHINGGRLTGFSPPRVPLAPALQLVALAAPLTPAQAAVVDEVDRWLPMLAAARFDGKLLVRLVAGEPQLPLEIQPAYVAVGPPPIRRAGLSPPEFDRV